MPSRFPVAEQPPLNEEVALNADVSFTLFSDITPIAEPQTTPIPVAKINYSATFDFVMSQFRGMEKCAHENFVDPETATARLLLLLAFVVRHSSANYTAWKRRRDVVLNSTRFLRSMREDLSVLLPKVPQRCMTAPDPEAEKICKTFADLNESEKECVMTWCPTNTRDILLTEDGCEGEHKNYNYSVWRAVRFELATSKWFCFRFQKNFQVWHHRKELIQTAVDAQRRKVASSFSDVFDSIDGVAFSQIDERPLCNAVLEEDSKNYHVWSHRSWFLNCFSELLLAPAPITEASMTASTNMLKDLMLTGLDAKLLPELFVVEIRRDDIEKYSAGGLQTGGSLQDELDYTAELITVDVFNNSAWSHRMTLVKKWLKFCEEQCVKSSETASSSQSINAESIALVHVAAGLLRELMYVVSCLDYEPCNESPFTFGIAICHEYAQFVKRVRSMGISLPAEQELSLFGTFLHSLDALITPRVAEVVTHIKKMESADHDDEEANNNTTTKKKDEYRPTIYLKQNFFQCDAAKYHLRFKMLRILATSNHNNSNTQFPDPDAFIDALKRSCKELATKLSIDDPIRFKYWQSEFRLIEKGEF